MPYIKNDDKLALSKITDALAEVPPRTPGELNYLITTVCLQYMKNNAVGYQRVNDVMGALEGAKMEFYRRFAAPYEDKKIFENGDVYSL